MFYHLQNLFWGFWLGGFLSGGLLSGVYLRGFCPDTILPNQRARSLDMKYYLATGGLSSVTTRYNYGDIPRTRISDTIEHTFESHPLYLYE